MPAPHSVSIRLYRTEDAEGLARVFHEAVQTGAARAYSQAQRDAWSPRPKTAEALHKRLAPQTVWVAEDIEGLCGFMTLAETGHLDMAFVHPRVQGKGAAARLYDAVLDEAKARKLTRLFTEASLLFKPFLDPRGWHVLEAEIVHMDGVSLERFRMAIAL